MVVFLQVAVQLRKNKFFFFNPRIFHRNEAAGTGEARLRPEQRNPTVSWAQTLVPALAWGIRTSASKPYWCQLVIFLKGPEASLYSQVTLMTPQSRIQQNSGLHFTDRGRENEGEEKERLIKPYGDSGGKSDLGLLLSDSQVSVLNQR